MYALAGNRTLYILMELSNDLPEVWKRQVSLITNALGFQLINWAFYLSVSFSQGSLVFFIDTRIVFEFSVPITLSRIDQKADGIGTHRLLPRLN